MRFVKREPIKGFDCFHYALESEDFSGDRPTEPATERLFQR